MCKELKHIKRIILIVAYFSAAIQVQAGNDSKRGQAGATQLLINPWARTAGWAGANTGGIRGVEAINFNVAGLAHVKKTEFLVSNTNLYAGSNISIYGLGFGSRVGSTGVMGISMMYFNLGDFYETTTDQPDGTGNVFKPQFFNFSLSYAKTFSKTISGGIVVKGVSESIPNASAFGLAFDAGVQYQSNIFDPTSDKNPFKFGIAIRNLGPKMKYSGPGFSFRGEAQGQKFTMTNQLPTALFEMPALLNIGASYDFEIAYQHRVTGAANFVSNTFTKDHYQFGAEYAFKEMFMFRGGLDYSKGVLSAEQRTVAETGPTIGASFVYPIRFLKTGEMAQDYSAEESPNKATQKFGIDYSYTFTERFGGTHRLGLYLNL